MRLITSSYVTLFICVDKERNLINLHCLWTFGKPLQVPIMSDCALLNISQFRELICCVNAHSFPDWLSLCFRVLPVSQIYIEM